MKSVMRLAVFCRQNNIHEASLTYAVATLRIIASAARKSRSYGGPQVPTSRKPTTQQF